MEPMGLQVDRGKVVVRYLDLERIAAQIPFGVYPESLPRGRGGNQLNHHLVADQRATPPIHADVCEQTVLDFVPLARTGWQVTDSDCQPGLPCPLPQLVSPQTKAVAVASSTVCANEQPVGPGI